MCWQLKSRFLSEMYAKHCSASEAVHDATAHALVAPSLDFLHEVRQLRVLSEHTTPYSSALEWHTPYHKKYKPAAYCQQWLTGCCCFVIGCGCDPTLTILKTTEDPQSEEVACHLQFLKFLEQLKAQCMSFLQPISRATALWIFWHEK